MRVLIVAKTRRGAGACVGAITRAGRSLRLVAADAARNDHAGLEYQVGEVWEIEADPDPQLIPPHVENVLVRSARRHSEVPDIVPIIRRLFPPVRGGIEGLFEGRLQALPHGALYIAERTGLPSCSTLFWEADQPLRLDSEGKRIRYRYPTPDGGRTLTYVGFQEPLEELPPGTLLRVSLAHWWRPQEQPEEELRCHAQLSGWFLPSPSPSPSLSASSSSAAPSLDPDAPVAVTTASTGSPPSDPGEARRVLHQTFGFRDFLPLQAEIVQRVLARRDTLVLMPTGGGKSLCYQLPALLFDGLTVVVSPLIALMQDQVSQLRQRAVPATFLNSTLSHHEYVAVAGQVRRGEQKILYVAPETLLRPETLRLLEQSRLACFAVDEAHCISEWGHDFRPEYRQLEAVRRRFPTAVCLALTATATARVRTDIRRLLGIEAAGEFVASFNRPNLLLAVQARHDGLGQTLAFLVRHRDQAGIIYCATRKQVDQLAAELAARGWPALPYHAGLEDAVRRQHQNQFLRDDHPVMVATIAFGMGINKANVRFVLHYHLPKDLESYYQEIGRAGRDGLPADCLLLHSRADALTIRRFIDQGAPAEAPGRQARLAALLRFAETAGCRRPPLLAYFGETHPGNCGQCDHCRAGGNETGARTDATVAAQQFLSCVQRTGECFGPAHLIDVLRGSRSQRVGERGHDRLPVYGVGKNHSLAEWRHLAQQFIAQGLLAQDLQFGGLQLTPAGHAVLAQRAKVFVAGWPQTTSRPDPGAAPAAGDPEVFEQLRELRRQLAAEAKVPAYLVFPDRTLVEMAAQLPQNEAELLNLPGVGQAKLARFGAAFLELLRARGRAPNTPTSSTADAPAVEPPATPWLTVKGRSAEIGELVAAGHSLADLRTRYGVKDGTVLRHLQRYHDAGGTLDPERVRALYPLSAADTERVLAAFARLGTDALSPVHAALGGEVPYEALHLLRLYLKCLTPKPTVA